MAVAARDGLVAGEPLRVDAEGVPICLCLVGEDVYAVRDVCTHENYPLSEGELDGPVLTCSAHGARFDVRTGKVLRPPAYKPVKTYPARVRDGRVEVEV